METTPWLGLDLAEQDSAGARQGPEGIQKTGAGKPLLSRSWREDKSEVRVGMAVRSRYALPIAGRGDPSGRAAALQRD